MHEYKLTIISPEGLVREGDVQSVVAPGEYGSFGVLAGHAPMMTALKEGILQVRDSSGEHFYVIEPGVLEINAKKEVVVLVDQSVRFDSLGRAREYFDTNHLNS